MVVPACAVPPHCAALLARPTYDPLYGHLSSYSTVLAARGLAAHDEQQQNRTGTIAADVHEVRSLT